MVTYGQFAFETTMPMPHASGRSPRRANLQGPNDTLSGALRVDVSELPFSIPVGVRERELTPVRWKKQFDVKIFVATYIHIVTKQ